MPAAALLRSFVCAVAPFAKACEGYSVGEAEVLVLPDGDEGDGVGW